MERLIAYVQNMSVEQLIGALLILAVSYLFKRQNDLYYKYNALNTNVFGLDKHTKYNGFKTGNSQGDFMLDWDGIPEELMTVEMFNKWLSGVKKRGQKKQAASTSKEA